MSTMPGAVPTKRWTEPSSDGNGARPMSEDNRSLGTLFKELSDDSTRLLRQEIELAKAEMSEKLDIYKSNMTKLVIGGSLLVAALFGALITLNHGLTALLDQFMELGIAYWLSPLLITIVVAMVGRSMVKKATTAMSEEGLKPRETMATIREEKQWIEGKVR